MSALLQHNVLRRDARRVHAHNTVPQAAIETLLKMHFIDEKEASAPFLDLQ
jgi:hypothetical protein